jgi:hypothetical protein
MKRLILSLSLLSLSSWAAEIGSDEDLNKKLITVIKEVQVESILGKSTEFNECVKDNEYNPKLSETEREAEAKKAEDCFKKKLAGKKGKELQELSQKLGLQSYGLVQSNNVKEISQYLGDKMYKAMTGIDRKDLKNKEMLKFKNRKLINQKVFIELYSTQLAKNALFEISRYCFENLRLKKGVADVDITEKEFVTYWGAVLAGEEPEVVDTGSGGFGKITNTSSEGDIYKDIFKSISNNPNFQVDQFSTFFDFCSKQINKLCTEFEKSTANDTSSPNDSNPSNKMQVGANSCLTKSRLQQIRKAIANSDKIKEQFDEKLSGGPTLRVDKPEGMAKFFNPSKDEANSIDNLTNFSSVDMLKGEKKNSVMENCEKNAEHPDCDGYLAVGDTRLKAEHAADMDLRLKKEMEKARVREIKDMNNQGMEEYLTENGYFDLLEKWNKNEPLDMEAEIEKIFEAKRLATLGAIKSKLGRRQISEDELKSDSLDEKTLKKENIQASKEERARLAQVVLFNNIITSHLTLRDTKGEEVGRNVNPWKKEQQGLEDAKEIDSSLFAGIKNSIDTSEGSGTKGNNIVGLTMLDNILGKKDKNNEVKKD